MTAGAALPSAPPTHFLGRGGWVVVAAISLGAFIAGLYLVLRPEAAGPLAVLCMGYAATAGLGIGHALMGQQARLELSFLLLAAYQASVHPARRVLPLLVWIVVVEAASTLIGDPPATDILQMISGVALLVLMSVMTRVWRRATARAAHS